MQGLAEDAGIPYTTASKMTRAVFGFLVERTLAGEEVRIDNFGQFKLRYQDAKVKLNNLTGEVKRVLPKVVIRFVPTRKLERGFSELI